MMEMPEQILRVCKFAFLEDAQTGVVRAVTFHEKKSGPMHSESHLWFHCLNSRDELEKMLSSLLAKTDFHVPIPDFFDAKS